MSTGCTVHWIRSIPTSTFNSIDRSLETIAFHGVPQYRNMSRSLLQESLAHALPDHRNDFMAWLTNSTLFIFVKEQVQQAALHLSIRNRTELLEFCRGCCWTCARTAVNRISWIYERQLHSLGLSSNDAKRSTPSTIDSQ